MRSHLFQFAFAVVLLFVFGMTPTLTAMLTSSALAGTSDVSRDDGRVSDGLFILLLNVDRLGSGEVSDTRGTYSITIEDAVGNLMPFTVRLRRTSLDGESKIVLSEEISAGRRVEGTMKVRAGDKVVARIVGHGEYGKAVAKIAAQ